MVLLLWGGAMGVDLGFSVYGSRQAQAMADTAALDLARYINIADNQANNTAATNYLDGKLANVATDNASNAGLTMTLGLWQSGSFTPESKCTPASPPLTYTCNAVDVTANQSVPQIFFGGFRVLSGHAGSTATTDRSTIAAVTPEASFSIGTYLASLTDPGQQLPVLNALLGTLGSASLTAVGYQGLANTNVTINQLVTASGGLLTTSNVLTTSLSAQEWLTIWTDAVSNQVAQLNCGASPVPSPCNAGTGLTEITGGGDMAQLCHLVSINMGSIASGCTNTTSTTTTLSTASTVHKSQCAPNAHDRGGVRERIECAERDVGAGHHRSDHRPAVPDPCAAAPGCLRRRQHHGIDSAGPGRSATHPAGPWSAGHPAVGRERNRHTENLEVSEQQHVVDDHRWSDHDGIGKRDTRRHQYRHGVHHRLQRSE